MAASRVSVDQVEILLFIICGGVLGAVISIVVFALMSRASRGRGACGRCRYDVEQVRDLTCPECGSDLRKVGITHGRRLRAACLVALACGLTTATLASVAGVLLAI